MQFRRPSCHCALTPMGTPTHATPSPLDQTRSLSSPIGLFLLRALVLISCLVLLAQPQLHQASVDLASGRLLLLHRHSLDMEPHHQMALDLSLCMDAILPAVYSATVLIVPTHLSSTLSLTGILTRVSSLPTKEDMASRASIAPLLPPAGATSTAASGILLLSLPLTTLPRQVC